VSLDVLVVGAGPAGLEAARVLASQKRSVMVIDREAELGGVPRHCHHTGFGWLDLRRVLDGPGYVRRRVADARAAGAVLRNETTALSWASPTALMVTSPKGVEMLEARAVLLATGCRERPRAARLVPGSRPHGVLTTGSLQQLVYGLKMRAGRRAVVVGAEHVSFSAVHTLASTGTEVEAMVTDLPSHQSFEPFRWATAWWHDVPILTRSTVTRIDGKQRVESVEITDEHGAKTTIDCDTVVFTGDWIPDHELARLGGLELDDGTRGPSVDLSLRTSHAGVFAAGNLLHGAETADVSALDGRHAAGSIAKFLDGEPAPHVKPNAIIVDPPLRWIFPNRLGGPTPPRGTFVLRIGSFRAGGELVVRQAGRTLHRQPLGRAVPNRPLHLESGWVGQARPDGGPVRVVVS
jgi:thioredoxin reductase